MNEVILILSRKDNRLYIAGKKCILVDLGNITGLYRCKTDNRSYAILSKGEYVGFVHNVVYVVEEW